MTTHDLTQHTFDETIASNAIVLIDFWAPWCGPCRRFGPIFEDVSNKHDDLVFGKVNTEAEPALATAAGITSIPTVMVFREGVLVYSQPGVMPKPALEQLIWRVKELDMEKARSR